MKFHVASSATFASLAVLAGAVLLSGCRSEREQRVDRFYSLAAVGQPESLLLTAVGKPDEVLPCGDSLWWNGDTADPPKNEGLCVKWVRYNFFLNAYGFGFSQDGKLVSRYHYISE